MWLARIRGCSKVGAIAVCCPRCFRASIEFILSPSHSFANALLYGLTIEQYCSIIANNDSYSIKHRKVDLHSSILLSKPITNTPSTPHSTRRACTTPLHTHTTPCSTHLPPPPHLLPLLQMGVHAPQTRPPTHTQFKPKHGLRPWCRSRCT